MRRILVIEDEAALRLSMCDNLRFEGYEVMEAERGDLGLALALEEPFDLVILDLMLPGKDGYAVCRILKEEKPQLPILMLSARDQTVDVVRGLDQGADDYMTKPFAMAELLARIRVRLREETVALPEKPAQAQFGNITLDFRRMLATRAGQAISLTAREFEILQYFWMHRGVVVSRDELLNQVWGYDVFPTTRTVDNYILRLRKAIETDPSRPRWLLSVRGVGYRLDAGGDGTPS